MPDKPSESKLNSNSVFVSWKTADLHSGDPFPAPVYLCLNHKFVRYKDTGDILNTEALNKLLYNKVQYVFLEEGDKKAFRAWSKKFNDADEKALDEAVKKEPALKEVVTAIREQRRSVMDFFVTAKGDPHIRNTIDSSKKMVSELLKKPFAMNHISTLQRYSRGVADHSVNVSLLSVFIGLRIGYTSQIILENLAQGGLFHDVGKIEVKSEMGSFLSDDDPAMRLHPKAGKDMLESQKTAISQEVLMIVAQHHEFWDGSGYPDGLKSMGVYDLARIVSIANIYDNLMSESQLESIKDRAEDALKQLEENYQSKFEPRKFEKAVKILRYSLI